MNTATLSNRSFTCRLAVSVLGAALAAPTAVAQVVYVDDDAPAGGDGTSWATAYRFLQDGLANVSSATEIRVGQGTYRPDQSDQGHAVPGDRLATFQLVSGVSLLGGFAGLGAPSPDDRDIALYETILTGDLAGDDIPNLVEAITTQSLSPLGGLAVLHASRMGSLI